LVILPQILFSEFAIAKDDFEGVSEWIYRLMPSRWGYDSLMEFAATENKLVSATGHLIPLDRGALAGLWLCGLITQQEYDAGKVPGLERAIGVIYRPETELQSHYFQAVLPRQFDE